MLPLRAREDMGAMSITGYSEFPKASALLEPYHQIVLCHIQDTRWEGVLPLCRRAVGVFYNPSRLGKHGVSIQTTTILRSRDILAVYQNITKFLLTMVSCYFCNFYHIVFSFHIRIFQTAFVLKITFFSFTNGDNEIMKVTPNVPEFVIVM